MNREVTVLPVSLTQLAPLIDHLTAALAGTTTNAVVPLQPGAEPRTNLGVGTYLRPEEDNPEDPTALVVTTSGSTGIPKGVLLSGGNLRSAATACDEAMGGPGQWLTTLSPHFIGGLMVIVRSIHGGTLPVATSTASSFNPAEFIRLARTLRPHPETGRRYTALVPTQLQMIRQESGGFEALRQFDSILVGGAATGPELVRELRNEGIPLTRTYGATETCGGVVYEGQALPGVTINIEAIPSDQSLPSGTGRITIHGPMVARGYRNDSHRTRESFARNLFRTSDLGLIRNTSLEVLNRLDRLINSGGIKIDPAPLEQHLLGHQEIAECLVVGVADPLWGHKVVALLVASTDRSGLDRPEPQPKIEPEAMARSLLESGFDRRLIPKDFFWVPALPLTPNGKPDLVAAVTLAQQLCDT